MIYVTKMIEIQKKSNSSNVVDHLIVEIIIDKKKPKKNQATLKNKLNGC